MANIPHVTFHHIGRRPYFIVTTFARANEDGFDGAWWVAADAVTGFEIGTGCSKGDGYANGFTDYMAIKNAKAACRRYHIRRQKENWEDEDR